MSLNSSRAKLAGLTHALMSGWQDTKATWNDAKCREFEERFLNELQGAVNRTYTSVQTLEKVLHQVRTDCD